MWADKHAGGFGGSLCIAQQQGQVCSDGSPLGFIGDGGEHEGSSVCRNKSLVRGQLFGLFDKVLHGVVVEGKFIVQWIRQQHRGGLIKILPVVPQLILPIKGAPPLLPAAPSQRPVTPARSAELGAGPDNSSAGRGLLGVFSGAQHA